jgi:hypothetical protein
MDDDRGNNLSADDFLEESRHSDDAENLARVSGVDDNDTPSSPASDSSTTIPIDDQQTDSNIDLTEQYHEGTAAAAHDFALPDQDDDDEPEDTILREPGA